MTFVYIYDTIRSEMFAKNAVLNCVNYCWQQMSLQISSKIKKNEIFFFYKFYLRCLYI